MRERFAMSGWAFSFMKRKVQPLHLEAVRCFFFFFFPNMTQGREQRVKRRISTSVGNKKTWITYWSQHFLSEPPFWSESEQLLCIFWHLHTYVYRLSTDCKRSRGNDEVPGWPGCVFVGLGTSSCVKFTHSTQGHNDISSQMQNTAWLQLCKKVVKR